MQTVEMSFSNATQRHIHFQQAATLLIKEIPALSPDDIYRRCQELTALQHELTDKRNNLFDLMKLMGPEILDTPFIGEFQRALEKSILACNALHARILQYRSNLITCPH